MLLLLFLCLFCIFVVVAAGTSSAYPAVIDVAAVVFVFL